MHNLKLIRRHFPQHATLIIKVLGILTLLGIVGGLLLSRLY